MKDCISGLQPSLVVSMYTIPHRETVAGEAKLRSDTCATRLGWLHLPRWHLEEHHRSGGDNFDN